MTRGHQCGRCGSYGHGRLECLDPGARFRLQAFADEMVDEACRVHGCLYVDEHITSAHWCASCGNRGGGRLCCPYTTEPSSLIGDLMAVEMFDITCPTCRTHNRTDISQIVHAAVECCVCFQSGPTVLFPVCRHATVCVACVKRLDGLRVVRVVQTRGGSGAGRVCVRGRVRGECVKKGDQKKGTCEHNGDGV